MTAERAFSILNLVAMLSWLPLILLPRLRWATAVVPIVMPVVLGIVYVVLIVWAMPGSGGSFSSLAGVRTLFANPWALLAGWVHYLAFDLFVGGWEVRDAREHGVSHVLVVPVLVLTFLFGPAGLLLYLAVRRLTPRSRAVAAAHQGGAH